MLTMSFANEEGSRQIQELTSLGRRIDKTRILFRSSQSLKSFNQPPTTKLHIGLAAAAL
jgi:hypothetical protein